MPLGVNYKAVNMVSRKYMNTQNIDAVIYRSSGTLSSIIVLLYFSKFHKKVELIKLKAT